MSKQVSKRYSILPIQHQDLWDIYKKVEDQFWTAKEIDISKDKYDTLTENEKIYLNNILAFFTISDGLVIDNLALNFLREVEEEEARYFYGNQLVIEQVHAEMYSLFIESYIKDNKLKNGLFDAMNNNIAVSKKAAWAEKWIENPSFEKRLVAFACVEGLSFSSVFAGVFYFRSMSKPLYGLFDANELILRDETMHYRFANYYYKNYVKNKLSDKQIQEIIIDCAEVEKVFVNESIPNGLNGMTKQMMCSYVEFVADTILTDFGIPTFFGTNNPLDFMAKIGIKAKNNFFERRIGEYSSIEIPNDSEKLFDENF